MKKPLSGVKLGSGFRITKQGKIERDLAAQEARLDISTRLQRRHSRRILVVKPSSAAPVARGGAKGE